MENLTFRFLYLCISFLYLYIFVENGSTSTCSTKDKKNAMFYHGMLKKTTLELFKNDSVLFRVDRELIVFLEFKITEIVILKNQLDEN